MISKQFNKNLQSGNNLQSNNKFQFINNLLTKFNTKLQIQITKFIQI